MDTIWLAEWIYKHIMFWGSKRNTDRNKSMDHIMKLKNKQFSSLVSSEAMWRLISNYKTNYVLCNVQKSERTDA